MLKNIIFFKKRCSECDKIFNCPANLASHKRWHKPKIELEKSVDMEVVEEDHLKQNRQSNEDLIEKPKLANLFENLPKIVENKKDDSLKFYSNRLSAPANQTPYYNNNSDWLSEMYKNYFLAAVAQNYLIAKQSTGATPEMASNSLLQQYHQTSSNSQGIFHDTNKAQNFTCKYCYLNFSDNFILNLHIRKSHSSILLNFN